MKIFLTGATGYIGTNLIPRLLKNQHEITCLLRSPNQYSNRYPWNRCAIIPGDITETAGISDAIGNNDTVIHLAVATPVTNTADDESIYTRVNVMGTQNLLEACRHANPGRIICFSSTAAIGRPKTDLIDEETPLEPVNLYGVSKREADRVVSRFYKMHKLPVMTICFPHVYGPGEVHELYKVIKMIKKGILPQVGFQPNHLPLVYVDDAIDAILLALDNGNFGEKYIIADDDPHDIRVIRRLVLERLGIRRRWYPFVPEKMGVFGAYLLEILFGMAGMSPPVKVENIRSIVAGRRLSIRKAQEELGFYPKVGIQEGINRTLEWYQKEELL